MDTLRKGKTDATSLWVDLEDPSLAPLASGHYQMKPRAHPVKSEPRAGDQRPPVCWAGSSSQSPRLCGCVTLERGQLLPSLQMRRLKVKEGSHLPQIMQMICGKTRIGLQSCRLPSLGLSPPTLPACGGVPRARWPATVPSAPAALFMSFP